MSRSDAGDALEPEDVPQEDVPQKTRSFQHAVAAIMVAATVSSRYNKNNIISWARGGWPKCASRGPWPGAGRCRGCARCADGQCSPSLRIWSKKNDILLPKKEPGWECCRAGLLLLLLLRRCEDWCSQQNDERIAQDDVLRFCTPPLLLGRMACSLRKMAANTFFFVERYEKETPRAGSLRSLGFCTISRGQNEEHAPTEIRV